jgi:hypothetical protein
VLYTVVVGRVTEESFVIVSATLNLNDEYLPCKSIVGQVTLDVCAHIHAQLVQGLMNAVQKNKGVKTVANKFNSIDTEFRFSKMELLAGTRGFRRPTQRVVPANTKSSRSTRRTTCLRPISQRSTGIPDYVSGSTGSFNCSAQIMSLRVCRDRSFSPSGGGERMWGTCELLEP